MITESIRETFILVTKILIKNKNIKSISQCSQHDYGKGEGWNMKQQDKKAS